MCVTNCRVFLPFHFHLEQHPTRHTSHQKPSIGECKDAPHQCSFYVHLLAIVASIMKLSQMRARPEPGAGQGRAGNAREQHHALLHLDDVLVVRFVAAFSLLLELHLYNAKNEDHHLFTACWLFIMWPHVIAL